jgi:SAM-dependent methyltransferase
MIFMEREGEPPIDYSDKYFFDDYKKQYGKTYLEDFPHLKELAAERVARIKEALPSAVATAAAVADGADKPTAPKNLKLLDVGSAYGPFLAAAKESSFFMAIGFDPSENAVRYTKEELGIFSLQGFFPADCDTGGDTRAVSFWEKDYFDALTMWYVIEHFSDLKAALEKAALLLKKGGVFAFSTPSSSGVSAHFAQKAFLQNSPADHWTIWSPHNVDKLLQNYGFTVQKVVITGHHCERFPPWAQVFGEKALLRLSQSFDLGDTFEVYAVKTV